MISDYYFATIEKSAKNEEALQEEIVSSIFSIYRKEEELFTYCYTDIFTNEKYRIDKFGPYKTYNKSEAKAIVDEYYDNGYIYSTYINIKAGIFPVMKYLKYINATSEEKKQMLKYLHLYDKHLRLEKKNKDTNNKLYKLEDKVKTLGGVKR